MSLDSFSSKINSSFSSSNNFKLIEIGLSFCGFMPRSISSSFSPFHFLCQFLPPNHLGLYNILGYYVMALFWDPLTNCKWAQCTFIIYTLSWCHMFRPWNVVMYCLALKSSSTTLPLQQLSQIKLWVVLNVLPFGGKKVPCGLDTKLSPNDAYSS